MDKASLWVNRVVVEEASIAQLPTEGCPVGFRRLKAKGSDRTIAA